MNLYTNAIAPSARRVRMFLAEKGIDVPTVEVDLRAGEQFGDAFRQVNPECMVPCLQLDSGENISESLAICRYFESLHLDPPLFGASPEEVARIEMWGRRCELNGFLSVGDFLRNSFESFQDRALPGPAEYVQIPALAERAKQRYSQFADLLDARLAESSFVAGDSFSTADITAFIAVEAGNMFEMPLGANTKNLLSWHKRIASRPSVA